MKEVPKKHLPDVSGGQYQDSPCIPPTGDLADYPQTPSNPFGPIQLDSDPAQT